MENFRKTFTYNTPAHLWGTELDETKTAEFEYVGPEKLWVFINEETNKFDGLPFLTARDNPLNNYPIPVGYYMVELDANEEPLICSLFVRNVPEETREETVEELPDGSQWKEPVTLYPTEIFDLRNIEFDTQTGNWVEPFALLQNNTTMEDIRSIRDAMLNNADPYPSLGMPEALQEKWIDYKQKLRDLPEVWADVDPWKVMFPVSPKDE